MSTEENKAGIRRLYEAFNQKNLAVVDELIASNYVGHIAGLEDMRGPEGVKQSSTPFFTAFPDIHLAVEDMVGEGDKVVTRYTVTGTHQGEFLGVAPTGKQATFTGMSMARIEGGKTVEEWEVWDMLGLMQQLGAIPTPGQG